MAKTIKFNLICNGTQVRTLEDLRNNFLMEDVYKYYQNKLLERWLQVHNYADHLAKVQAIGKKPKKDTIIDLINIFEIETDTEKINEGIYIMEYEESRVLFKQNMEAKQIASSESLDKYLQRYEELKKEIVENSTDKSKIQSIINEIVSQYFWIFKVDYRNLFYQIRDESFLAVLCLLMNPETRPFYIFDGELPSDDRITTQDIKTMYEWIKGQLYAKDFTERLGHYLVIKDNNTGLRFSPITSSSKQRCMILKLVKTYSSHDCAVSNQIDREHFFTETDVKDKFMIFDGIEYQSDNSSNKLYYIEV